MEQFLYRLNGGEFERDYIVSTTDGYEWPPPEVIYVKDQAVGIYRRTFMSSAEKPPSSGDELRGAIYEYRPAEVGFGLDET